LPSDVTITALPPTRFEFAGGQIAEIATERWELVPWDGEPDPPELALIWARKPKITVGGRRSCAELAIVDHLRHEGWHGVWVNAFERTLRTQWFLAPAFATLTAASAPPWASAISDRLLAANGGKLSGFFDVFAWREPGEVRFCEAKTGNDKIRDTQRRFLELALRFHPPAQFTIIQTK
jgi:hypothetical protein